MQEYTLHSGRQPPLPDWVMSGPIIGYYGGSKRVLELHSLAKDLGKSLRSLVISLVISLLLLTVPIYRHCDHCLLAARLDGVAQHTRGRSVVVELGR